ncbi:hypothetical protein POI8812_02546 [Pontivivens insulae]|uniref:Uncharacterized protein n=2 Tax=Pontivivens insulae TaxID=1639689 RepID=A0A2R8ADA2_9RHOB|nr:hypothetical protein DFR53_1490 [Pontivivens insulae]SPF30211.1 hypothetical protein POI8812_02546 [Pontivivens insulae]
MLKEELYRSELFRRNAFGRLISADLIVLYAEGLHSNREVVADIKFAHEANSEDYSDDDFASLGGKVSKYMHDVIESTGQSPYHGRLSGNFDVFVDFNGWYLERVVYGGHQFKTSLQEYIQISPYIQVSGSKV